MKFGSIDFDNYLKEYPNKEGFFGPYGGAFIPEELKAPMAEITEAYFKIAKSRKFIAELRRIRKEFQGRPTFPSGATLQQPWQCPDLRQARGSEPQRRPQAEPLHG